MSDLMKKFDKWLLDDGPAALVIREYLMPVEGQDGVLFPATFAAEQGTAPDRFKGGYNLDSFGDPTGSKNVCLVDSVGSQANRIEPLFAKEKYAGLVPQVTVKAGEKVLNLLVEAGHRAGDAIVRCTALQTPLHDAFKAVLKGNVELLARIAPTSLVFGVWDSRDTQAKLPRLVSSTIRAWDVQRLTRHAQYVPATAYVDDGLLPEPTGSDATYSERGFIHQPVGRKPDGKTDPTHGGVIAAGGIRRDATLSLAALRQLHAGTDEIRTLALRRYVLGLALVAFTYRPSSYLRQGCNLVPDPDKKSEFFEVFGNGRRTPAEITHDAALTFAEAAARAFGVGENRAVEFDKELARRDVQGDPAEDDKSARKSKKK